MKKAGSNVIPDAGEQSTEEADPLQGKDEINWKEFIEKKKESIEKRKVCTGKFLLFTCHMRFIVQSTYMCSIPPERIVGMYVIPQNISSYSLAICIGTTSSLLCSDFLRYSLSAALFNRLFRQFIGRFVGYQEPT